MLKFPPVNIQEYPQTMLSFYRSINILKMAKMDLKINHLFKLKCIATHMMRKERKKVGTFELVAQQRKNKR